MNKAGRSEETYTEEELDHITDLAVSKTSEVYEAHIKELKDQITELECKNYFLHTYIEHLEKPKTRGRPKKVTLATMFGMKPPSKGSGRKKETSHEEMVSHIEHIERLKTLLAQEKGVSSVGDKEAIEHFAKKYEPLAQNNPYLSDRKIREFIKEWRANIKYYRDQTDIRTRKNKKRKTA